MASTKRQIRTSMFSIFGKARKISLKHEDILQTIETFIDPGVNIKKYSVHRESVFWANVCKDLGVPNNCQNRKKIYFVALQYHKRIQVIQTEVEGHTYAEKSPSLEEVDDADFKVSAPSKEDALYSSQQDVLEDSASNGTVQSVSVPAENPQTAVSPSQSASSIEKDRNSNSSTIKTDSSNGEEDFFRCSVPQEPCFFFIEQKDWEDLKKTQKGRLFQSLEWTNVISKGIKTVHPFRSFGFKRHSVKTIHSRSMAPVFSCMAYCRFDNCPVTVNVEVQDEKTLQAKLVFDGGEVCHSTKELKTRPVRAKSRKLIADKLENKLPRSMYLESLQDIQEKVFESGCRDEAPAKHVLKTISWSQRQQKRPHSNEMASLQLLIDRQQGLENEVLQRVLMHPKGVMLWSKKTLAVFYHRCKEDIFYFDATGSIIRKDSASSAPYYVYEVIVRNPCIGSSPLPIATYVTCDHTTASVTYFLQAMQTELKRMYGKRADRRPVMIICDGSLVLLQSLSVTFCRATLEELLEKYFKVITGQIGTDKFDLPILHRCLSHIMKNAKDLCKKSIPKYYKFGMHIIGLLACSSTLTDMDNVIQSASVVFQSPCSGPGVAKHLRNLKILMRQRGTVDVDDSNIIAEDYKVDIGTTSLQQHFVKIITNAPLDISGEKNVYYAPSFISSISKYFLPHATLWSGMLLGDLGRHGQGPPYDDLSKRYCHFSQLKKQNYTVANRTQGIMEKSQWDLKKIRFQRRRLTRLDDFVDVYQQMHDAVIREYRDVEKSRKKSYRVETETWKKKSRKRKGIYVSPLIAQHEKRLKIWDQQEERLHSDVAWKQPDSNITTQDDTKNSSKPKKIMEAQLSQDVSLSVWTGDLCTFKVDAVVNAANKELQHCGGLALAISEAGGPKIQAECDDYIAKNGPLKTGEAVVCSAGNLPCKKIIHVVGPNLRTKPTGKAVAQARPLLRRAILSVLEMAEENMLSSIAIPAISSGIFNFPTQTCVDIIVKTIHDHVMQKTARSPPFEICLIDKNNITAKEMERACKKLLCDALSNVKKKVNLKKEHPTETSKSQLKSTKETMGSAIPETSGKTDETKSNTAEKEQLTSLWKKRATEVVVAVVPSQVKGNNFVVHHSELKSLEPHQWLTGEIIECALHDIANNFNLGSQIYIMNHYTAGVILFGKRELMRRNCLSKVNFDNYQAILSFVNVGNVHWKFLYLSKKESCVYLVDPARNLKELEDSEMAAQKFREFFKMRRTSLNKTDWVDVKLRGGVLQHPVQKDTNSCGVIVILMAKAVMEAFPNIPKMTFVTTVKAMVQQRHTFGMQILQASVFDTENNCSMCSTRKPPIPGASLTKWIQCDSCSRWFHIECLQMNTEQFQKAEAGEWDCSLCE